MHSELKDILIEDETESVYHVKMVDIPRRDEVVTLYLCNGYVMKTQVTRVEWTGSWKIEEAGYPEVTVYVKRL